MAEKPLISVLIPNFNRGDLIAETLGSVADQTYENWEAIIVDDGSNDNSEKIALDFVSQDSRFSWHRREQSPSGAPTCRNIALELAKGELVMFLDSDDVLAPHCLAQRCEFSMKYPDMDFWVFPMLMFKGEKENGKVLWNQSNNRKELLRFLELDAVWQTSGPLWKKKSVQSIGAFTEGLACWQDVDIHLKALIQNFKYLVFDSLKPDIYYRMHETGSISQGEINSPSKMESRKRIFLSHAASLLSANTDETVTESLAVLGSNVVFGAIKVLNTKVANECIRFGYKHKIFSFSFLINARTIQLMFLLRLNKIAFLHSFMQRQLSRYRVESQIGKVVYIA